MRHYTYLLLLIIFASCSSSTPKEIFEERTGLKISDSIKNVDVVDNYEIREGEFSIVFKTTENQIKLWLDSGPPWENAKWQKGKIPYEIGVAVKFNFPDGVSAGIYDNGESMYFGNEALIKLLNDSTNYYSFVEDCCPKEKGLRFHNGRLLIIQPQTKMVYFQHWDF
jgi:hypothetical protein